MSTDVSFGGTPTGPPPDEEAPYIWTSAGWLLLVTDGADGVPESLDLLDAQEARAAGRDYSPPVLPSLRELDGRFAHDDKAAPPASGENGTGDGEASLARPDYTPPTLPSLQDLDERSAHERYNPHHDKSGRFGSGGGAGGGVRPSLAAAKTVPEVDSVLHAELKRITGRDVIVDQSGSDVQIAREHSEGILRVAEQYPKAPLHAVRTVGPGAADPATGYENRAYATTQTRATSSAIYLNNNFAGNPTVYHQYLANDVRAGFHPATNGTPMATAAHEMVHVVANHTPKAEAAARATVVASARRAGVNTSTYVSSTLGRYAAANVHEMTAEAVSSAIMGGGRAHRAAHEIKDQVDRAYRREPTAAG